MASWDNNLFDPCPDLLMLNTSISFLSLFPFRYDYIQKIVVYSQSSWGKGMLLPQNILAIKAILNHLIYSLFFKTNFVSGLKEIGLFWNKGSSFKRRCHTGSNMEWRGKRLVQQGFYLLTIFGVTSLLLKLSLNKLSHPQLNFSCLPLHQNHDPLLMILQFFLSWSQYHGFCVESNRTN